MEETITLRNTRGKQLIGIVHYPDTPRADGKKLGVNLLNPGIKYRVAPNRLNVKIARRLCQLGFCVLRFDPEGIGDSEGELVPGQSIMELWGKIQRGQFVKDTKLANDFFCNRYNIDRLTIIGNCGGAITAILSAVEDPRVDNLILIDVPVMLIDSDSSFVDRIATDKEKVDYFFKAYLKKIFQSSSWKNLLKGNTDLKALKKVIELKLKGLAAQYGVKTEDTFNNAAKSGKLNMAFFRAFESLANRNKHFLFITAGMDGGAGAFNAYFRDRYIVREGKYAKMADVFTIENANHIYTLIEWQQSLIEKISNWLS